MSPLRPPRANRNHSWLLLGDSSLCASEAVSSDACWSWVDAGGLFIIHFYFFLYYLFIYLLIYLFIYLFIYSFIHLFIYSFIHLFIYSFIHLFIYSFIHECLNLYKCIQFGIMLQYPVWIYTCSESICIYKYMYIYINVVDGALLLLNGCWWFMYRYFYSSE